MRRRVVILLGVLVPIILNLTALTGQAQSGAWSLRILESDDHHLLLELTLPAFESDVVVYDGIQYRRLRVAGWPSWGQPGQPQLPMHAVLLGSPWPGMPHISVVESESETLKGYLLYPTPGMELGGTQEAPQAVERFTLDSLTYSTDTFYPGRLAEAASSGFLRDQPVFQLRLYPFQYNPLRRELRIYHRLKVEITFPKDTLSLAQAESVQPSPVFERILERTLLNYDALPRSTLTPARPLTAPQARLDAGPQVKLRVEQSGLYRVTYDDLLAVAPALLQVDPRHLELSNQGSPVSILFSGEADGTFDRGDSFLFYGQAIHSDFARQNVYWLTDKGLPGLRMAHRDGTPGAASTPGAFGDSRHYEEDHAYWRAVLDGEGKDHWFWSRLLVSGSAPVSADYAFTLRHIATAGPNGRLRVMLLGATFGDHLTQLYLNGVALLSPAERAWSDKVEKLYEIPVPQSLFVEGTNYLRVENIRPASQSSSEVYVNWFEISYQDTYVAEDGRLLFSAPSAGTYTFQLTGFSTGNLGLFDITNPAAPVRVVNPALEPAGTGYRLRFNDSATADSRYLARQMDQLPTPSLQLDEPSAWKSAAHGATYVIITHPSFCDALLSLATYRAGRGETVVTVKTDDVYDEFNHGLRDPQAIRAFLEYAYDHWSPRPVYVLLVGDASADPKNNRGSSLPDLLPAYYVDTPLFGQTAADAWYARVHGDDEYPDVIVGRIPARYASDVTTVVNKVHVYEQSPPAGNWTRRAVLVADDGTATFTQDMDTIAGLLPGSIIPTKMVNYSPNTSVQSEVSAGALLFAYSGHGDLVGSSWGTWPGGHSIFNQSQMQNMWNGNRLPFMTVANCLSGLFDQYDRARTMAEEFLLLNNKGGIASWAPASYGFLTPNSLILEELYHALLVEHDLTLGSAATTARIEAYLHRPDLPLSLFEAFTYFGDPAVRLNVPATLRLDGRDTPDPGTMGEWLTYTLTYTVSGADQARGLTLVNTLPQQVTYQSAFPLPSSIYAQTLTWNLGNTPAGSGNVTVTARVSINGLAHGQIVRASTRLYDATGGDRVLQVETTIHDSPVTGLEAHSDSPTQLGSLTTLSATIVSGTNGIYHWDVGDGSPVQSGVSVQHTYPAVGTYLAQVTATNGVSSQSRTIPITITDVPPAASFTSSSPDRIGQSTVFQSTSLGTNLSYLWNFGDGSPPASSPVPTAIHAYPHTGTYTVGLTVSNSAGSSTAYGAVDIVPQVVPPVAGFTSSSPDEFGQTTTFLNTSQDGGDDAENIKIVWNLGDGTSSVAQHPTHTYAAPGTYLVSLTVSNSVASDTVSDTVLVRDAPISGLAIGHASPAIVGHAATLSATIVSGTRVSYLWALGDGAVNTGQSLTHAYRAVGNYTIVLTATNSVGSQVVTDTVQVIDDPIEGLGISHSGPTTLGGATALTASVAAGTGVSYLWSLGDGSTSTSQTLVHTYTAVGDYTVVLTATNSWGSLVMYAAVSVRDVPISGLSVSHDGPTALGIPTTLTATVTTGTNVVYNWDLGDGHLAAGARVTHTYVTAGTYDVTVTAVNGMSAYETPAAVFVFDPDLSLFLPLIAKTR